MTTNLNSSGSLPTAQPYGTSPWNYSGSESVTGTFFSAHSSVVDWVLVDLRSGLAGTTLVTRRAGLLLHDGTIVDYSDAASKIAFPGTAAGNYYVVIRHRNHLPIMSASTIAVSTSPTLYDFSTAQAKAYTTGGNAMKSLGGGVFGMFSGEVDFVGYPTAQESVTIADVNICVVDDSLVGYVESDFDFNGFVDCQAIGFGDDPFVRPNFAASATDRVPL